MSMVPLPLSLKLLVMVARSCLLDWAKSQFADHRTECSPLSSRIVSPYSTFDWLSVKPTECWLPYGAA